MVDSFEELRKIARSIGRRLGTGESLGVELPPKDRRPTDSSTGETMSDYATKRWIKRENERIFPAESIVRHVVNPVIPRVGPPFGAIPGFLHRKPIPQYH